MTAAIAKPPSLTLDDERPRPDSGDRPTYLHHLARYEFALQWIGPRDHVLEAGCGVGYGARLMAQRAARVVAADYSELALAHAQGHFAAANLHYIAMDCHNLAVPAEAFDAIVCFEVLEHLTDQPGFVESCRRALRPGGTLLLSTPNRRTAEIHMASIQMRNEFHVGLLELKGLRRLLEGKFAQVEIFGQRRRGSRFYGLLRAADVFNLRLRLVAAQRRSRVQAAMGVTQGEKLQSRDWVFTRRQLRQANNFVAVCRK